MLYGVRDARGRIIYMDTEEACRAFMETSKHSVSLALPLTLELLEGGEDH